jgi:hypothetical protein
VSGIGQHKTVDAAKLCGGADNVAKVEVQQTFVNGLLSVVTLHHAKLAYSVSNSQYLHHTKPPAVEAFSFLLHLISENKPYRILLYIALCDNLV